MSGSTSASQGPSSPNRQRSLSFEVIPCSDCGSQGHRELLQLHVHALLFKLSGGSHSHDNLCPSKGEGSDKCKRGLSSRNKGKGIAIDIFGDGSDVEESSASESSEDELPTSLPEPPRASNSARTSTTIKKQAQHVSQSNHHEPPRPSPKKPKPADPRHRKDIRSGEQSPSAASVSQTVAPRASSSTQPISSKQGSLKSSAADQTNAGSKPLSLKRKRSSPSSQHTGPTLTVKRPASMPHSTASMRISSEDESDDDNHPAPGWASTSTHQGQTQSRPTAKREQSSSSSSADSSPPSSDVEIVASPSKSSKGKAKAAVPAAPPSKHQRTDQQADRLQPPTAKQRHTNASRDGSESAATAASQTSSLALPKKGSREPAQTSSKSTAVTYTSTDFTPPGQSKPTFKVRWCSNKSGPHYISILASDASKKRVPHLTKPEDLPRSGTVSAYVALDPSADVYKRWMWDLGSELSDFLNLDEVTNKFNWLLEGLPPGYRLIERLEGTAGRPSRTTMLCGSKFASTFYDARRELVKHLMNLINAGGACSCQNCLDRIKRQGGSVHLPEVPENVPSSKSAPVLGAVDGPMHSLRRALEEQHRGFTWSPARGFHKIESHSHKKDSVKANVEGAESFKLKKRATGYGGPYVDPHQSEDIERALSTPSSWVRMKEVVWYKLPRPIRSPRLKDSPIITHWPAVVCERKTVSRPKLAGPMPPPAKSFDGTLHNEQFTEWHVRLLGCCDFVWSTMQELLPFLAYKPFTRSFSDIKPDGKSFSRVWDAAAERPIWPAVNALGSLEEAYVPFAVALQHASYMMRKVVLCDPFAFRVSDPELSNSKLSGGKHNESVRNWSAPKVCHFQGAFIGAERVWVGDLLRLRINKPSKALVPLYGETVDPALFVDNHGAKLNVSQPHSLHRGKEKRDAPEQLLQNRCLLLLLNSIWQHPTTDRVFVSGYVYELKKKSSKDEPTEAPAVPQDMPPLPPAPPGYHFCLLVPLPAEHSFEIESLAGRLYRSDIHARRHPDQSRDSEENQDAISRAMALTGRRPGHELYTPFQKDWEESRYDVIRQSETKAIDEMRKFFEKQGST